MKHDFEKLARSSATEKEQQISERQSLHVAAGREEVN